MLRLPRTATAPFCPSEVRGSVLVSAATPDAYHLLDPLVGGALASVLFGIALLASGQSSTFTGTIAGQILMEGFLDLKIPCWQRRVITRGLALVPAFGGVMLLGEGAIGKLLVAPGVDQRRQRVAHGSVAGRDVGSRFRQIYGPAGFRQPGCQ